jgi:hypothetical protein
VLGWNDPSCVEWCDWWSINNPPSGVCPSIWTWNKVSYYHLFGATEWSRDSISLNHLVEIHRSGYCCSWDKWNKIESLLESPGNQQEQYWTDTEKEGYWLLQDWQAVVKTIKNNELMWFLHCFKCSHMPIWQFPQMC